MWSEIVFLPVSSSFFFFLLFILVEPSLEAFCSVVSIYLLPVALTRDRLQWVPFSTSCASYLLHVFRVFVETGSLAIYAHVLFVKQARI